MKTRRNQSGNFRPCARVNLSMALLTARHFIVVLECESLYGCVEEHIRCRYLAIMSCSAIGADVDSRA